MDPAIRCRTQAEEYHRLVSITDRSRGHDSYQPDPQLEMIANQTDKYLAIIKREAAQKR
jgi:hypothetical protein